MNKIPFDKLVSFVNRQKFAYRHGLLPVHRTRELKTTFPWWESFCNDKWMSFEDAREYVRNLKFKNVLDWFQYSKTNRPRNIPSFHPKTYSNLGWVSWYDWLGHRGNPRKAKDYIPFNDAKAFVHSLGLKNRQEWNDWIKNASNSNLPYSPFRIYKDNWVSWGDWLGTGRVASKLIVYLPFEEARNIIRSKNFKRKKEWEHWHKQTRPRNIPSNPCISYKNTGWLSIGDWLGTKPGFNGTYLPFEKARTFVRSLKLKTEKEWNSYCKLNKPHNIPYYPSGFYDSEFQGMDDWLGTGRISNKRREYLSFEKARELIRSEKLKSVNDWRKWFAKNRPNNISSKPNKFYDNTGWVNWYDWLGLKS